MGLGVSWMMLVTGRQCVLSKSGTCRKPGNSSFRTLLVSGRVALIRCRFGVSTVLLQAFMTNG